MANLTGDWNNSNGDSSKINDNAGVLAVSPISAPWTNKSFGAWGQDSKNQDSGKSNEGVVVFVYDESPLTTDTETFSYDAKADSITFANKQVWTRKA